MLDFLLIRHAKSSWNNPNLKDSERPLNKRGEKDAPRMAEFCKRKNLKISHLISSPAVRAYSTAQQFANIYGNSIISFLKESDLYFGDESDWLDIINNLEDKDAFPAFFSHNPTITYFANSFEGEFIENVPTCGIVHLRSNSKSWSKVHYNNSSIVNVYFPKLIK